MRICALVIAAMVGGCNNGGLASDPAGQNPSAPTITTGGDECGAKTASGAYSCAYLVGSCNTVGLSCFCWENGTMVCQPDHQWQLIGDNGCPFGAAHGIPLDGSDCLGGHDTCYAPDGRACACDHTTWKYRCGSVDMSLWQ